MHALPLARAAAALAAAGLFLSPSVHATEIVIDDFTTGPYTSKLIYGGTQTSIQYGAMQGGQRDVGLTVCPTTLCPTNNPFNQPINYAFMRSRVKQPPTYAMIVSSGFDSAPARMEVDYGYGTLPMQLNLSTTSIIRLDFLGLSDTLNLNLQMFSGAGHYGQAGCNLTQYNAPFSVEMPFAGFAQLGGGFTASDISNIVLILQSSSAIGSIDLGLARIVASDTPTPGAFQCRLV